MTTGINERGEEVFLLILRDDHIPHMPITKIEQNILVTKHE
jgi:hypothetical protein